MFMKVSQRLSAAARSEAARRKGERVYKMRPGGRGPQSIKPVALNGFAIIRLVIIQAPSLKIQSRSAAQRPADER